MIDLTLFEALQESVAQRLNDEPFFATSGIRVVPENRLDVLSEIERSLSGIGVVGFVMTPSVLPGQVINQVVVTLAVQIVENVVQNRGVSGTRKTGLALISSAWAVLRKPGREENTWSRLKFASLKMLDAQGESVIWELRMTTETIVGTTDLEE